MCGRFILDAESKTILERFHLKSGIDFHPRKEVFPGTDIYYFAGERVLNEAPWGMEVDFLNRPIINTRIEKIYDTKFFLDDFTNRRLIVPATGFYEWNKVDGSNDRYLVTGESELVGMAAICNFRGEISLLTKAANDDMSPIHHRMPIFLPTEFEDEYLNSDSARSVHQVLETLSPKMYLENTERYQQLNMF